MLTLFTSPEKRALALIANAENHAKQLFDTAEAISGQIDRKNKAAASFGVKAKKVVNAILKVAQEVERWAVKKNYGQYIQVCRLEELRDRTLRTGKAYQRFLDGI